MPGWFNFGTPTEEVDPETISEALGEQDFDPILAVRTLEECDFSSSFDCSNDVSLDSCVATQKRFHKNNGNVLGRLPSSSKSEGRKQPLISYEVQPESPRSVAAATYPKILNVQTLEQRKSSVNPVAKRTTSIQKSSRSSVTSPDDTGTNQLDAIEPPHRPTTEATPAVLATRTEMPALETVVKASSTSNIKKGSEGAPQELTSLDMPKETYLTSNVKEDREEMPQLHEEKLMLILNGSQQPEEEDLNSMVEARGGKESLTSIVRRLTTSRRKYTLMSDIEEKPVEKKLNRTQEALNALTAFSNKELEEIRQRKEKMASLTSKDGKEESPVEMTTNKSLEAMNAASTSSVRDLQEMCQLKEKTNTSLEAMNAASASSVRDLQEMLQLLEKNISLVSYVDKEKADEKGSNTTEEVMTSASVVEELREEELRLEGKVSLTSNKRETAEEKESKLSGRAMEDLTKVLSIVEERGEELRQLNAKKPLLTSDTQEKLEEKESYPTVVENKTSTSANTNGSLSMRKTTKKGSYKNKDDVRAALDFYTKWKTENDEPVKPTGEATPIVKKGDSLLKNEQPVDQQCKAPLQDLPKVGKPPRDVPRFHHLKPQITTTVTNKARRDPPFIKWLETSDSHLASMSSLGTFESREDVNGEESRAITESRVGETGRSMKPCDSMELICSPLKDSSVASTTTIRKKVRFEEEPQDDFDDDSEMSYLDFNVENLSYVSDDDMAEDSVPADQMGCNCSCSCDGGLFSGLRELVQDR